MNCVRCPQEKTVIAQKRLDGVLIEPPAATSCVDNKPFSQAQYQVQTLFDQYMFILPEGNHKFIAKIFNMLTKEEEKLCSLKYKVIVRQCAPYRMKNTKLRIKCDLGNIWGSICTFSCKNKGIVSHQIPVICDDDLEWTGHEPTCHNTHSKKII